MTSICLHGPESTGKSMLVTQLSAHFGCEAVPEYGRAYCEAHGTDIGMAELVHIGETQDAMNRAARARSVGHVVFDTDSLITSVWAEMMFGVRDPWFDTSEPSAEIYLLLDIDLPFVDDGLRVYADAADRARFFDMSRAVLEQRGVRYALVSGTGDARFDCALAAIGSLTR